MINLFLYQVREDLIIDLNKIIYIQKQYYDGNVNKFTGYYHLKLNDKVGVMINEEEYNKLLKAIKGDKND